MHDMQKWKKNKGIIPNQLLFYFEGITEKIMHDVHTIFIIIYRNRNCWKHEEMSIMPCLLEEQEPAEFEEPWGVGQNKSSSLHRNDSETMKKKDDWWIRKTNWN